MLTLLTLFVWALLGFIAGVVARAVTPGRQALGLVGAVALGVIGSYIGGLIMAVLHGGQILQPSGLLMSILGAVLILVVARGNPGNKAWS